MSRIGKKTVVVPDGVTVAIKDGTLKVNGAKGELSITVPPFITVTQDGSALAVTREGDTKEQREMHGTIRSTIVNMITGVKDGYSKNLEILGVGYRAEVKGDILLLYIGKAHPVEYTIPQGIELAVENNTRVSVKGIDTMKVGSTAAKIRSYHPPEPYKGKGIKYANEHVRRKTGKTVAGS